MKLLTLIFLFISLWSEAQNIQISGRIINQNSGEPLPDAYIVYQHKTRGAIADRQGYFNISIPEDSIDVDTIYITHLGYSTLRIPWREAMNKREFALKLARYALPGVEIRVPERNENWNKVFLRAVREYDNRRRDEPYIALGQYVEEASYLDTPVMYMESLGYIVFMGELPEAAAYSNMKFFCDQTRAYVTDPGWQKYKMNGSSLSQEDPVFPGATSNINVLRVFQEDGLLAPRKAKRYRCHLDSSYMMRQYPVYILRIKHKKEKGSVRIMEIDGHYLILGFRMETKQYWSNAFHRRLPAEVSIEFQYYENTPFVKRITAIQKKDGLEYHNRMVSIIQKLDTFSLSPDEYWNMNLYSANPYIDFNPEIYDRYALDEFRKFYATANTRFLPYGIDLNEAFQEYTDRWFLTKPGKQEAIDWIEALRKRIF